MVVFLVTCYGWGNRLQQNRFLLSFSASDSRILTRPVADVTNSITQLLLIEEFHFISDSNIRKHIECIDYFILYSQRS
jgi:hypothetical protein